MNDQQPPIPVAVVGVWRMGKHHARKYAQMPGARLVGVVDADAERAGDVAEEFGCRAFTSVEELLAAHSDLQAASIATPTRLHDAAARPLLKRGVACLIEKPLAPTAEDARELTAFAAQCGAVLQVGHTERFNPAVRAVSEMDIRPRYMEVDRVSPMSFRSLDVSVVMDLMIHDLDILLMLADSPIARVEAAGVAVVSEYEDVASARLVFQSGCVANLTASRLALKTERKLRVFSEHAYVSLDYQKRGGIVIRRAENELALEEIRHELAQGKDLSELDYASLVHVQELDMDAGADDVDQLTAELASFLDAVRTGAPPIVDGQAGTQAVDAARRVIDAIAAHQWEGLDGSRLQIPGPR